MKKVILAISLAVILLVCGCGADTGSVTATSLPQASNAAETAPVQAVSFTIPRETKVYARP